MKKFFLPLGLLAAAMFCYVISGCAMTRKINAAEILSHTTVKFDYLTLDSVEINKDLFPKSSAIAAGLLPNPQVVSLVQDFARGILEKELGTIEITAGLVAHSDDPDTLWIRGLTAMLKLDTLMELPIALKDSVKLAPGGNNLAVTAKMPIDRRIFQLKNVSSLNMKGAITVSLEKDGESVSIDFDVDKPVSQEEKQTLMDNARNSILNNIVSDWVGAIEL